MSSPNPIYTAPILGANQNNYEPEPDESIFALLWRLSASVPVTLTGLAGNSFQGEGLPTRLLYLANAGVSPITLAHESAFSSPSNRFSFATGVDKVLAPGETVNLLYDSVSARWRQSTV